MLAPAGSEQATLLNLTDQDRRLDDLPLHKELLTSFLTKEARCARSYAHAAVRTCLVLYWLVFRSDAPIGCRIVSQPVPEVGAAAAVVQAARREGGAQVVWWSSLSDHYEQEMKQQADIFAGPYGEQALKDFRCEIRSLLHPDRFCRDCENRRPQWGTDRCCAR